jgi:XapX domain-containing protein
MKAYLFSLGAGLIVGVVYSLMNVRSPAPPLIALVGLLGILVGEQIIPVGKKMIGGSAFTTACSETRAVNSIFGRLPGRQTSEKADRGSQEKSS